MGVNILRTGNIIDRKVSDAPKEFENTHIQFNKLRILEQPYPDRISNIERDKRIELLKRIAN